jgi:hypothetical protein
LEDDNDDDDDYYDNGEEEKKKVFNAVKRHYQYSVPYIQEASSTLCFHH